MAEALDSVATYLLDYKIDIVAKLMLAAVLIAKENKEDFTTDADSSSLERKTVGGVLSELALYGVLETRPSDVVLVNEDGQDTKCEREYRLTEYGKRVVAKMRD